jgi:uncharacterized damage-inducible protein DinB
MMQQPLADRFVGKSTALFDEFLSKIEKSVAPLADADVWWRPNEVSNSIANLLLHLNGNVTQWIVGGVGQRPYTRERQQEFDERSPTPARDLVSRLRATVQDAIAIIGRQTEASLLERRSIQGYDVTVLEAIYHVVEHFSMHTGQIIMLAKMRHDRDLQLWTPIEP